MTILTPLTILHFISPLAVLPGFASLLTPPPPPIEQPPGIRPIVTPRVSPRRSLILGLISAIAFTYFGDGVVFVAQAVITGLWDEIKGASWATYALGNVFLWSFAAVIVIARNGYMRKGLVTAATFAMVVEIVILVFSAINMSKHHDHSVYAILHLVLAALRVVHLPVLLWSISSPRITFEPATPPSETDALLPPTGGNTAASSNYGATTAGPSGQNSETASQANGTVGKKGGKGKNDKSSDKKSPDGTSPTGPPPPSDITWSEWFARFVRLAPFLWPSKSGKLQILAAMCMVILVLGRAVNVMVPRTLGNVVDALGSWAKPGMAVSPWPPILFYIGLRFCQGNGGILSVLNNMLWAPVMQYSDREMSTMCFNHLLDLSLAFHTKRKTGEVLRILDRGSAINNIFQTLLMNVAPVLFDIAIATIYFYVAYGWVLASVIGVVMTSYIAVSISLTTWRSKLRRQMNERDIVTRGIHTDVLMNWESVKYFTSEQRESARYAKAINDYQTIELRVIGSLNALNLVQNAIITSGLLAGTLIVAYRVTKGTATAAEFVVFLTYLGQLYGPLNMLGMIYRQLNAGLVDAEKLLRLLEEQKEIVDKPDAKDLVLTDGVIEFRNVEFSYDGKVQAVDGISFTIEKGQSVALVGSSGSGKSSLLRLLYRFYEVTSGEILIDGQNIQDVTQRSLRSAIGIVPQDCTLWNDSIEFNIGYGKEGASEEEIREAAKAARLDERINGFPEGYKTVVGERGVRLSGGEKQRVSLARTILKAPSILVLDEATSALDTENERFVQQSLNNLAKGRSSLIIAHRLSTLYNTDKIIVLGDGKVLEVGTHKDLLNKPDGVFAAMWQAQIQTEVEDEQESGDAKATPPTETTVVLDADFDEVVPAAAKTHAVVAKKEQSNGSEPSKGNKPNSPKPSAREPVAASAVPQHADPFSVDIENMGEYSENTPRSSHNETTSQNVPASMEDLSDPPMLKETKTTDDPIGVALPVTPVKPSIKRSASVKSSASSKNGLPFPTSPAGSRPGLPHSVSNSSNLGNNSIQIIASSQSSSAVSSPKAGMSRSNSTDIASLDTSPDGKKRKHINSIGGLVRRVSEQGKAKMKSVTSAPAGTKSPAGTSSPLSETTPLMPENESAKDKNKRFSLKAKKKSTG